MHRPMKVVKNNKLNISFEFVVSLKPHGCSSLGYRWFHEVYYYLNLVSTRICRKNGQSMNLDHKSWHKYRPQT